MAVMLQAACESTSSPQTSGPVQIDAVPTSTTLNVENLSADPVLVRPWNGAPQTTVGCLKATSFQVGKNGAPGLPWRVVVRRQNGRVLLDRDIPFGSLAQEVIVRSGGAFMRNYGGSLSSEGVITCTGIASGARLNG